LFNANAEQHRAAGSHLHCSWSAFQFKFLPSRGALLLMSPCSFDVSFVPILPSNQNRSSGELAYRYFLPFSSEIICMMILQEIPGKK
jgi:hypothetical protein